jgi:hypothetical protein
VQRWLAELWNYPIPWETLLLWAAIIVAVTGAFIALAMFTMFFGKRDGLALATKKGFDVAFVATYDDGRSEFFNIDKFTLRSSDHIARVIAGERQRSGQLPAGKIVSVKRLESSRIAPDLAADAAGVADVPLAKPDRARR